MTNLPIAIFALLSVVAAPGQINVKNDARSLGAHDPNPKSPVGSRHVNAPEELSQLSFLLGAFDASHRFSSEDGEEESSTEGAFGATYCLNGYGLRHYAWDSDRGVATAGFYVYEAPAKRWRLVVFRMPEYEEKIYYGSHDGDRLTLTETDRSGSARSRLVFESLAVDTFRREEQVSVDGRWLTVADSDFARISDGSMEHPDSSPHGRPHPDAPGELSEFSFMVGEFDTKEEIRNRDGSWRKSVATWNASYFLSGFGIRDYYWNEKERFATANIRVYDPASERWYVTFFSMPGNSFGSWEGGKAGDRMVMRPRGSSGPDGSRLTFFNISDEGYDWVSERVEGDTVTANWREFAQRARP